MCGIRVLLDESIAWRKLIDECLLLAADSRHSFAVELMKKLILHNSNLAYILLAKFRLN